MKKFAFWSTMLLLFAILAACAPETPVETTEESSPGSENGGTSSTESEPLEVAGDFPAANLVQAANERNVDHFKGAEEPLLTVIEYGDFQ